MNHVELDIEVEPLIPFREIVVALLADQGFESFVEYEKGVKAYTPTQDFDESAIRSLLADLDGCSTRYQHQEIPHVNWNAEWEKDYHPVEVTEDCVIRALFHEPMPEYAYELIIQPQMSFGTGHHPTTLLMMQMLLEMDLEGREVIDLGCGTGVLAILAEKKGAQKVL
ncbi:MAG: 50S ribosomal protein L11 methyltransferase, partial [Flavobacteriales bacterium]|nr:50S ribosomal protein L11 methyltransferase [Flavobacteriales bacterium]